MFAHALIITETPNGRTTPKSVWDATDEPDFISRVVDASPRDPDVGGLHTTEQVVVFLNEKYAQSTRVISCEDFLSEPVDSFDPRVISRAIRLGWI